MLSSMLACVSAERTLQDSGEGATTMIWGLQICSLCLLTTGQHMGLIYLLIVVVPHCWSPSICTLSTSQKKSSHCCHGDVKRRSKKSSSSCRRGGWGFGKWRLESSLVSGLWIGCWWLSHWLESHSFHWNRCLNPSESPASVPHLHYSTIQWHFYYFAVYRYLYFSGVRLYVASHPLVNKFLTRSFLRMTGLLSSTFS